MGGEICEPYSDLAGSKLEWAIKPSSRTLHEARSACPELNSIQAVCSRHLNVSEIHSYDWQPVLIDLPETLATSSSVNP